MSTIEPVQMQLLAASATERFDRELAVHARRRFPATFEGLDDQYMRAGVRKVRATARGYGIERQDDVATFIDFMIMFGVEFHRAPWAVDILECKALHGPDKMAVLRHRVAEAGPEV
jgi:hypothetical protein